MQEKKYDGNDRRRGSEDRERMYAVYEAIERLTNEISGKDGLRDRLTRIESKMEFKHDPNQQNIDWAVKIIFGALLLAILGLVIKSGIQ